jgi:hypothetical protein
MSPKIDRDAETGEYYEVEQWPTKRDWILGGVFVVVGLFGLMWAHVRWYLKSIRGW